MLASPRPPLMALDATGIGQLSELPHCLGKGQFATLKQIPVLILAGVSFAT